LAVFSGGATDIRPGYGWCALVPKVGLDLDRVGLSGSASHTLMQSCPAGAYRVTVSATCASISGVDAYVVVGITQQTGSAASVTRLGAWLSLRVPRAAIAGSVTIEILEGPAVSIAATVEGDLTGGGTYDLRARLEAL